MSRTVEIVGDHPVFPVNACVSCLRPAERSVEIVKVKGYQVRKVSVPLCTACLAVRDAKSRRQVLFERAAAVNGLLLAAASGAWAVRWVVRLQGLDGAIGRIWGGLIGALVAATVFGVVCLVVPPWSRAMRTPASRRVWESVAIQDFDWETTTLVFASDEYAERFAQVNAARES